MTLGLELLGWDPGAQLLTFLPPAQPRFPRSLGNLNDTEGSIPQPLLGWPLILGLLSPTWEPRGRNRHVLGAHLLPGTVLRLRPL